MKLVHVDFSYLEIQHLQALVDVARPFSRLLYSQQFTEEIKAVIYNPEVSPVRSPKLQAVIVLLGLVFTALSNALDPRLIIDISSPSVQTAHSFPDCG